MGSNSNCRWSLALDSWAGLKSYKSYATQYIRPSGTGAEMPSSHFSGYCFRSVNESQNHVFRRLILAQQTPSHGKSKLDVNAQPISNSRVSNPPSYSETSPNTTSMQARHCSVKVERIEVRKPDLLLGSEESAAAQSHLLKQKEAFNEERKVQTARTPQQPSEKEVFDFPPKKIRGIIVLNILAVVYASNIPVIKETEALMDPSLFSVCRFAVTTIPFMPFMLIAWRDAKARIAGLELGFWVSAGYLSQGIGLLTSDAGRASFISAFTVIVVPLLDGLFGARIPKITWLGAAGALLGIGLLESSGSPVTIGDFWNFLSAVFFGIHMLRTEHYSRITKRDKFVPLLGYEIFVVALFSAMWYILRDDTFGVPHVSLEDIGWAGSWHKLVSLPWLPILYTGVFSTGFCLWAELAAMRDVSATETAIIYGLEPLWGAAFAWFLLGERWGSTGWLGAILILGGSLTVQVFGSPPEKPSISSSANLMELKEDGSKPDGQDVLDNTKHLLDSRVDMFSRGRRKTKASNYSMVYCCLEKSRL